ncbi:PaaI family thioesterase [Saccharicrinis sp. FJH54]|uniref:PaaI family thioesterase n=1 Tax=Saccharicrinis sp. FJH54 TaxID=3344665 RepID=UPI0035D45F8B
MKRKIRNPFSELKGDTYNCFACSPHNDIGLHLEFWEEGEEVTCEWEPERTFEGYYGVVHGGMQATLMDEIAAWTIYVKCGTAGVTTGMEIKYKKPLSSVKGKVRLIAKVLEQTSRLAKVDVKLYNSDGILATESVVSYFLFPVEKAQKEFKYPGVEAFFS